MRTYRYCIVFGLVALLLFWLCLDFANSARAEGPASNGTISFINDVAPILKERCFACHDSRKRSGKYDMTTFEKLMEGGSAGEAITPGKLEESPFHDLMITKDERRMPPRKDGLSPVPSEKIEIIRRWIEQGAKLDKGIDPKADLVRELRLRWQPPTPPVAYKFGMPVTAMAFSPDGKNLVTGGNHELTVWESATGKLTKRLRTRAERAHAMVFHSDGNLIVAGGRPGQEGDIRVYDLRAAGKIEGSVTLLDGVSDPKVMKKQLLDSDDSVLCLVLSPDGNLLGAGGCDRTIRVWDVSAGAASAKLEQTIDNHADWIFGLAFDAEGNQLLSASRDKTAKIWDLLQKESVTTFPEHQAIVYGVAWSKDGKLAYSAGADKQLRQWNAKPQGKQLKVLGGHNEEILKVIENPTQTLIVTAGADKSVKLWDLANPKNSKTFQGLTDQVFSAALSPDAQTLAAGDYNGEVRIWNIADGKVLQSFNASPGFVTVKK
jgi:WD40 repeat protein